MVNTTYHIGRGEQIQGEYAKEQILSLYKTGTLLPSDTWYQQEAKEWFPLPTLIQILMIPESKPAKTTTKRRMLFVAIPLVFIFFGISIYVGDRFINSRKDPTETFNETILKPAIVKHLIEDENVPINATFDWLKIYTPKTNKDGSGGIVFSVLVLVPSRDNVKVVGVFKFDLQGNYSIDDTLNPKYNPQRN
jgi:hypothetical protein